MNVQGLTIKKLHDGLTKKEFSALETVTEIFKIIETKDKEIGAYLTLEKSDALERAVSIDKHIAEGKSLDPIGGLPIILKDNMVVSGGRTTASSKMLDNYIGTYDATVVKKLKEKGAIIIGKTNMDEFAMGASTENSAFQKTKNPHDLTRVPGGSSGGSAAAVASDMAVAALGSDTGGSVRQPAGFCGVVGLKPTYGAVSRFGLIAMASSLDHVGPITKTVEDARILFDAMKGNDPYDSTSAPNTVWSREHPKRNLKDITIGIPKEYFIDGIEKEVGDAVESARKDLEKLGVKFKEVSLPHTKYAVSCYYIVVPAEVSTNLARYDGIRYASKGIKADDLLDMYVKNRGVGFGPESTRRILLGTFVLSSGYYDAYYLKAQKVRTLIKQDFDKVFKTVDMLFTPTSPTVPFKLGERTDDPMQMYLADIFTIPADLSGVPAMSIPVKKTGLPVGFQLMGKPYHEHEMLSVGEAYERG